MLAGVYLLVVAPLLDLYAERAAAVETRRMLLPRLERRRRTNCPGCAPVPPSCAPRRRTHKITLEGASDAIAAAALQSHIEELAASAGATIGSTESLPTETRGAYRRIGLRLCAERPL